MVSMVKIVGQHAGVAVVAKFATKKMAVVLLVRPDSQDHSAKMVWTKLSIFLLTIHITKSIIKDTLFKK